MSDPNMTQTQKLEVTTNPDEVLVLVVADLHLDELIGADMDPLHAIGVSPELLSRLDLLIMAGDLCDNAVQNWPIVIRFFSQFLPTHRMHIFEGNHDLFETCLNEEPLRRHLVEARGAHYAQKSQVIVGNLRFLCCTLWSDFELNGNRDAAIATAAGWMPDYGQIFLSDEVNSERQITPADTLALHIDHLSWLEARLCEPFGGKTIVVTHHAPSLKVMGPVTPLSPCFGSDLEGLILRHAPAAWYCGHCHSGLSAKIGNTQVIEVSVGYPDELGAGGTADLGLRGLIKGRRVMPPGTHKKEGG